MDKYGKNSHTLNEKKCVATANDGNRNCFDVCRIFLAHKNNVNGLSISLHGAIRKRHQFKGDRYSWNARIVLTSRSQFPLYLCSVCWRTLSLGIFFLFYAICLQNAHSSRAHFNNVAIPKWEEMQINKWQIKMWNILLIKCHASTEILLQTECVFFCVPSFQVN